MLNKLYSPKHYAAAGAHYLATAGIAAGAIMLGQPWALVIGAALAVGLSTAIYKLNRELFENHLKEHPKIHEDSPHLGKMVEELYKKSGLSQDRFPVYDFQIEEEPENFAGARSRRGVKDVFREALKHVARTPNAAAFRMGRPIIIITEPLLKLLSDEEEKAVLAHEFAHAAAHHVNASIPQKVTHMGAMLSNSLTLLATAISTGWGFVAGIASGVAAAAGVRKLHPKGELLTTPKSWLSLPELHERKKVENLSKTFASVASVGTITAIAPYYLPVYAAVKGMSISAGLISKSFSRANEYQADEGAVKLGASPLALITSLRKINALVERSREKAWDGQEVPKPGMLKKAWTKANATHPYIDKRVDALVKIARNEGYSEEDIDKAVNGPVNIDHAQDIPLRTMEAMASRFVAV